MNSERTPVVQYSRQLASCVITASAVCLVLLTTNLFKLAIMCPIYLEITSRHWCLETTLLTQLVWTSSKAMCAPMSCAATAPKLSKKKSHVKTVAVMKHAYCGGGGHNSRSETRCYTRETMAMTSWSQIHSQSSQDQESPAKRWSRICQPCMRTVYCV